MGGKSFELRAPLPVRFRVWLLQTLNRLRMRLAFPTDEHPAAILGPTLIRSLGFLLIYLPLDDFLHQLSQGILVISPQLFFGVMAGLVAWGLGRPEHWDAARPADATAVVPGSESHISASSGD